jgi:hypothetical protein
MFCLQNKKRSSQTRNRKLYFDQLEERAMLSIVYPVDPSAVTVDNGILTATFIPLENLTINPRATVDLTALPGDPTENLSIKNTANNGSLNITG